MVKRFLLTFLSLLWAATALAQTNPCTSSTTATVYGNPSTVAIEASNYSTTVPDPADPTKILPDVTDWQYYLVPKGADPNTTTPLAQGIFQKGQLRLVTGTTDCYTGNITLPVQTVSTTLAMRSRRILPDGTIQLSTTWVVSNPSAPLPTVPAPPVAVRVIK